MLRSCPSTESLYHCPQTKQIQHVVSKSGDNTGLVWRKVYTSKQCYPYLVSLLFIPSTLFRFEEVSLYLRIFLYSFYGMHMHWGIMPK